MTQPNPLMAFQPHARIFLTLPTKGMYYAEGVCTDGDEDIGVRKMSAKDEMLLKNPDALMNGKAVSMIVDNCVSDIHKVDDISVSDMEALLLAIKLATGEAEYEINTSCPECKTTGMFTRDIESLLFHMTHHEGPRNYVLDTGLVVNLKPNSWKSHSKLQQIAFNQQQLIKISKSDKIADDDKMDIFRKVFADMVELNTALICDCIASIETPDASITDAKFIREYVELLDKTQLDEISVIVTELNNIGIARTLDVQCSNEDCKHEWTLENLRFDPSYFFAPSSSTAQVKK